TVFHVRRTTLTVDPAPHGTLSVSRGLRRPSLRRAPNGPVNPPPTRITDSATDRDLPDPGPARRRARGALESGTPSAGSGYVVSTTRLARIPARCRTATTASAEGAE